MKFSLFSDFHHWPDVFPDSGDAQLEAIWARAEKENVDFIIHAGDLCHGPTLVPEFVEKYNNFHIPSYHVVGNHEFERSTPEDVKKHYRQDSFYYYFDCKGYRIIAFDPNYNKVGGEYVHYAPKKILSLAERDWIPPEQVAWLKETIESSPHPCILIGHGSLERPDGIHNREEILGLIRQANRRKPNSVLMVINGHYHRDSLRIIDNVAHFEINSTSYDWSDDTHQLYPQELRERVYFSDHCVIYNDPVHAIVTLEGTTVTIEGMESSFFMGVDRKTAGWEEYDPAGRPCTATVLSAKFTLHQENFPASENAKELDT